MLEQSPLAQSFASYDQLLSNFASYWQVNPFACQQWPWAESAATITAAVAAQLQQLTDPVVSHSSTTITAAPLPFWLTSGIAGRKLAQITGFISHFNSTKPIIEWCAGKGHLGRLLSFQRQLPVRSLEWQANLCQQGQALAHKYQLPQQFQHCDVMTLTAASLPAEHAVVALHACGDLHRHLIEQFSQRSGSELFVAPCCYHLQAASEYKPLSQLAKQSPLRLSRSDLKLAVQEFVTAGQRTARLRDTEQLWRLLFQLYRAELTQDPNYQPLPAIGKQIFSTDITAFMQWGCQQHSLEIPSAAVLERLLPFAHQRLQLVRAVDQVRQLFRRPLELWLLLDRALLLHEQGYQVELRQFCHHHQSPRNTLIIAKPRTNHRAQDLESS